MVGSLILEEVEKIVYVWALHMMINVEAQPFSHNLLPLCNEMRWNYKMANKKPLIKNKTFAITDAKQKKCLPLNNLRALSKCVNGKTLWINTLIVFNSILNYALLLKARHVQHTLSHSKYCSHTMERRIYRCA